VRAGLEAQQYLITGVALAVGILTLFSMTKIWNEAFLKEGPDAHAKDQDAVSPIAALQRGERLPLLAPIAVIAVLMLVIGLAAEPIFALSLQAAEQLLDPTPYIQAVLGG
jgi:multicomponent Na+:H+ antiporter subunit D